MAFNVPLPVGGIAIPQSQMLTQQQLDSIRRGLIPYYQTHGVLGYRTIGSHGAARTVAIQSNGTWIRAFEVLRAVASLPGASLDAINRQIAAILAQGISDASGGFYRDALIGGAIFLSAGAAGAYALGAGASSGAGVTALPGIVTSDAGAGTVVTAAVDTGSTLTTTALADSAAGAGGSLGGLGSTLGAAAKGMQTFGDFKAAFGGKTNPAPTIAVASTAGAVAPAPKSNMFLIIAAAAASLLL